MADVFLSYKAEDRGRVAPIVRALEGAGLSVWWDALITGGASWRQTIQDALDAAGCVVVVWSRRSIGPEGHFVHDEATRAQRRGVYLPVRIDPVDPPIGFGEIQAISLTGWKGDARDPAIVGLIQGARATIAGAGRVPLPVSPSPGVDRRLIIGGAAAGIAAISGGGWLWWRTANWQSGAKSIAVMPFENLSGDPAQAYFADGIAEELRSALARVAQLQVIGRTSSELMRNVDAVEAAKKLGVANILTGSVRRSPTTIRITAQLIDGSNGVERWSQSFDRAPGDVIQIQSGIAQAVASELRIRLGMVAKADLTAGGTTNPDALDKYLKAEALLKVDDDSDPAIGQAISLVEQAVRIDPQFATGWAKLAYLTVTYGASSTENLAQARLYFFKAEAMAKRAIAIAPRLGAGYRVLGFSRLYQLHVSEALTYYKRAYALSPGDADLLLGYARFLGILGYSDQAISIVDKAIVLDPLHHDNLLTKFLVLDFGRRYGEAAQIANAVVESHSGHVDVIYLIARNDLLLGKTDAAVTNVLKIPPDNPVRIYLEAVIATRRGDRARADQLTRQLMRFGDSVNFQLATIYAQMHDADRAFAALDAAWAGRDAALTRLRVEPLLDPIRADPRFAALMAKLTFP